MVVNTQGTPQVLIERLQARVKELEKALELSLQTRGNQLSRIQYFKKNE